MQFFRSLLNAKPNMLDPDIPKRLPQQPVASTLAIEPTEKIATAIKVVVNAKAVESDGLPVVRKLPRHLTRFTRGQGPP